jgi:class 3 adenylate cyclase
MEFPKPVDKRPVLALASKSGVVAQVEAREAALNQRADEVAEQSRQLEELREELEQRSHGLQTRERALTEAELLLKSQKLLHQKQFARLLDQNELEQMRADLQQREDDLKKRESFLTETQQRLNDQFAAREEDLRRREAWISAEHEKAADRQTRRLRAIVFTDVVSFSALMQVDESTTIRKVRADLQRMCDAGRDQGGLLINTMGDGMLMIFPSAIQAVRFSLGMQREFNQAVPAGGLQHRFGIHIADIAVLPDGGIAGDGVNIASRLESKAPRGGICLSGLVHLLVKGKLRLPPCELEEVELKNIAEPVAVYKYTPDAILAMPPLEDSASGLVHPDEERTSPPFAVKAGRPPA